MPSAVADDGLELLEEEEEDLAEDFAEDDRFGKLKYLAKCEELGIRPVSQLLKYLEAEELHLGHYGIGLSGVKALVQALQVNKNVSILRLNDNNIPDEGVHLLIDSLTTHGLGITELDLSENKLGMQACKALANYVLQSKPGCLVVLHLSKTKIGDKEGIALAQALENNLTLRSLDLSSNLIGERAGPAIGNMLAVNNGLQELNLSWNLLRTKGTASIAEGLKSNLALQILVLAWCGIQDAGAAILAQAIVDNKGLVEIDLTGNGITSVGAASLCNGVAASHSLASVALDSNDIREEGGQAVLTCVNNNQGLVKFRIDNTNTSEQLRAAVEAALSNRRTKPGMAL